MTDVRYKPAPRGRMTVPEWFDFTSKRVKEIAESYQRHGFPKHRVWWERSAPLRYWTCQVAGGPPGLMRHYTLERARREAVRLALKLGQPVYVNETVAIALPSRPPAPAVELQDYRTGEQAWFNHPQEVDHMSARERKDERKRIDHLRHKS